MNSNLKPDEDYLDEDRPFKQNVKKQNFCVISMLTPNSFPESKREHYKDQPICGIKVRGVFETYEDAKIRCNNLQKTDKYHNIFVGEIGKWLPFNVDISKMETDDEPVYREQALNQYMKAYKDCLKEEEVEEQERKDQILKANNAKIVTGMTGAPKATGLGNPEIKSSGNQSTNVTSELNNKNVEDVEDVEDIENVEVVKVSSLKTDVDSQITTTQENKSKIEAEIESSKNNLKELESKIATISELFKNVNQ